MAIFKPETHRLRSGESSSLRSCRTDDVVQYSHFDMNVLRDSPLMHLSPEDVSWPSEEKIKDRILKFLQSENDLILIAESEGQIIGKLEFKCGQRNMTHHKGYFDMAVDLRFRGRGVGRLLLKGLLDWVKYHPRIEVIQLNVLEENAPAVSLYRKFSFVEIGKDPYAHKMDGRFFSELTMSLKLVKT